MIFELRSKRWDSRTLSSCSHPHRFFSLQQIAFRPSTQIFRRALYADCADPQSPDPVLACAQSSNRKNQARWSVFSSFQGKRRQKHQRVPGCGGRRGRRVCNDGRWPIGRVQRDKPNERQETLAGQAYEDFNIRRVQASGCGLTPADLSDWGPTTRSRPLSVSFPIHERLEPART